MDLPDSASFVWSQDSDDCADNSLYQALEIKVEDSGGGKYLVLITDRWAIDPSEIDAFVERLKWCLSQVNPDEPSKESK